MKKDIQWTSYPPRSPPRSEKWRPRSENIQSGRRSASPHRPPPALGSCSGAKLRFAVGVAGPRRNPSNQRENTVQHCSYTCLTPVFNRADPDGSRFWLRPWCVLFLSPSPLTSSRSDEVQNESSVWVRGCHRCLAVLQTPSVPPRLP